MQTLVTLFIALISIPSLANNTGIQTAIAIPQSMNELVKKVDIGGRILLTDSSSISLYTFDADSNNQTACFGGCLNVWPALIVPAGTEIAAPFGTIIRPDSGELQLTIDGLPLYYFFQDSNPGDLFGEYADWRPVPVQ